MYVMKSQTRDGNERRVIVGSNLTVIAQLNPGDESYLSVKNSIGGSAKVSGDMAKVKDAFDRVVAGLDDQIVDITLPEVVEEVVVPEEGE